MTGFGKDTVAPCYCQHCRDKREVPAFMVFTERGPETAYIDIARGDDANRLSFRVREDEAEFLANALQSAAESIRQQLAGEEKDQS